MKRFLFIKTLWK